MTNFKDRENVAFSWFYFRDILAMHRYMNVKNVILIAFSWEQWLRERVSISSYSVVPVLLESV